MSNILDYIKWRGDLTIQNDPFNEIDSLILSRFSYLPFDGIIEENEVVTSRDYPLAVTCFFSPAMQEQPSYPVNFQLPSAM